MQFKINNLKFKIAALLLLAGFHALGQERPNGGGGGSNSVAFPITPGQGGTGQTTAAAALIALGSRTNVTIFTNTLDTNQVIASGAGTSAANGTFVWAGLSGGIGRYTNGSSATYYDDPGNVSGTSYYWYSSNASLGILYIVGSTNLYAGWFNINGTGNTPSAAYGYTNQVFGTETRSLVGAIAEPLNIIDTNIYVDSVYGYNVGSRGPFTPWNSLTNAQLAANSNDVIIAKAGTINMATGDVITNINFQGSGRDSTYLVLTGSNPTLSLTGTSTIANMDLNGCIGIVSGTNNFVNNVRTHNAQDGILFGGIYSNTIITSYEALGDYDLVNCQPGDLDTSNCSAIFLNCNFNLVYDGTSTTMRAVAAQNGIYYFIGGSINIVAGPATNGSDYTLAEVLNTTGQVHFIGTRVTTSGPVTAVHYTSGAGTNTNSITFDGTINGQRVVIGGVMTNWGSLVLSNLTASTAIYADANKTLQSSTTTPAELALLHGGYPSTSLSGLTTNGLTTSNITFVTNTIYTNISGSSMLVQSGVLNTTAAVTGNATMQLVIPGSVTNAIGPSTTVAVTIAMPYTNQLSGSVSNLGTFYFNSVASGSGNSASLINGTGQETWAQLITVANTGNYVAVNAGSINVTNNVTITNGTVDTHWLSFAGPFALPVVVTNSAGAGGGSSAIMVTGSNDERGIVNVNSGTSATANSKILTIIYANTLSTPYFTCPCFGGNNIGGNIAYHCFWTNFTTTSMELWTGALAVTSSTTNIQFAYGPGMQ